MSIGIRADSILLNPARIPLYVAIGVVALLIAAGLGWLLGGVATRPLRRLTEQTRRLGETGGEQIVPVHGAKEAEDLSEAMVGMLTRLAAAQTATTKSLQAAQDFAANAAHELRTPLTAMRADLDTLRIHALPPEERAEVVADLARAQRRVEATITALGQLASGQLAQDEDRELIDVEELLDRVARENMRVGAVEVEVRAEDAGLVLGWAGGLRLAVDNLVRNAVAARPRDAHRAGRAPARPAVGDRRRRQRVRAARRGVRHGARPLRARQHGGGRWLGSGSGAGGAAGGAARRPHRAVRRSAGRRARDPDGFYRSRLSRVTARHPNSSAAVTADATTTKLSATP